jgi:hypothetical protein
MRDGQDSPPRGRSSKSASGFFVEARCLNSDGHRVLRVLYRVRFWGTHIGQSQSVANRLRISSGFGNLNQALPVLFLHERKAGEPQTDRTLPLSRQYAPDPGTPKSPHPIKQRQNFIECRRLDSSKVPMSGIAGLAAAAAAIFSHGSACISVEGAAKIYRCRFLSNRFAFFPCFAEIGRIGHFALQFSTVPRRRETH